MTTSKRTLLLSAIGFAVFLSSYLIWLSTIHLQRALIYSPRSYTKEEEVSALEKYGFSLDNGIDLMAADKTKLRAYWLPYPTTRLDKHQESETIPTVLYLHGNMGKIEWGLGSGRAWQRHMPVNFLVVSYRGFGRSEGETATTTMKGVQLDSQAALDYLLTEREDIDKKKIVLYGHSLGGAVALHLAADNPDKIAAIIVENTFLKIAKVVFGNSLLAGMIEPLITDHWNNEAQVERILARHVNHGHKLPHILLLSGLKDQKVPSWHTDGLWSALQKIPTAGSVVKMMHQFIDGTHNCHTQPDYHFRIKTFLEEIFPSR